MAESTKKTGFFEKIGTFFKGVKSELKKISWPTMSQTGKQTLVVVIISLLLCGFIRLIDLGALELVKLIQGILA